MPACWIKAERVSLDWSANGGRPVDNLLQKRGNSLHLPVFFCHTNLQDIYTITTIISSFVLFVILEAVSAKRPER